ncbi:MAG: hypothetical protein K2N30_05380 [Clostridia bacterium]|nr:hypothetical protein [Clostridia bacterium]
MKKETIIFIAVGVLIYVMIIAVEFYYIYSKQGDNIWNYLNDLWEWYKKFF